MYKYAECVVCNNEESMRVPVYGSTDKSLHTELASAHSVAQKTAALLAVENTETVVYHGRGMRITDVLVVILPLVIGFALGQWHKEPTFWCGTAVGTCSAEHVGRLLDLRQKGKVDKACTEQADARVQDRKDVCTASEVRAHTGGCELKFGIEKRLLGKDGACVSLYAHACARYTSDDVALYGVPRAFVSSARANAHLLDKLQAIESVRAWSADPWARLASTCDSAIADPRAQEEDERRFAAEVDAVRRLAHTSPERAIVKAQAMGASVFVETSLRALPTNRSVRVLYAEPRSVSHPPLVSHRNAEDALLPGANVWALITPEIEREAHQFWRGLVEFFHLGRTTRDGFPETLYGYALRSTYPSLQNDFFVLEELVSVSLSRLVEAVRAEYPDTTADTRGLWAFAHRETEQLLDFVTQNKHLLGSYLTCVLVDAVTVWKSSVTDAIAVEMEDANRVQVQTRRQALRLKMASSPPHAGMRSLHWSDTSSTHVAVGGTWRRECTQFATSIVWWRVDKWYREASLQRELREPLMAVFEHVREAMIALVDVHFSDRIDSELHAFLRQKLTRVKLRFVTSAPEKYTSGSNLTNIARFYLQEVLAVHRHSFSRFAPFRDDDGHMLDAIDIPSFVTNAFYCATDNTLVILPGMLNGAFYDYRATAAQLLPTVGSLMGHELAHAIDTRGIWYGLDGTVIDHSERDQVGRYLAEMACIVDTFSAHQLDGERVLDESFADAVGLQAAFYAYQLHAHPTAAADKQNFFIQYAQLWCGQMNDQSHASWEQQYGADPHAPPRARVDFAAAASGVHAAFHCPPDTLHACKPLA